MPLFTKTLSYQLAAAVTTGVCQSQSGTAGAPLSINGSLATAGVATLDSGGAARRVIISSGGNDTGVTFSVTGTDRYGRSQTDAFAGASGAAAQSVKDFLTVTKIVPSGNVATYITAGTNGVGSSAPQIVNWIANGNLMKCATLVSGTVTYTVEEASDDLAPAWDLTINNPNWFADTNFNATSANVSANLAGPFTMVRITVNAGTGKVTGKFITPFIGGSI